MSIKSSDAISVFQESILGWHEHLKPTENPYGENSIKFLLYKKNQIDTIQWHKEDEIRRTDLDVQELIAIKRDIDKLNQDRTELVELIDDYFVSYFQKFPVLANAHLNSETPAWMLDRMSILELKIWHMTEQTARNDVQESHIMQTSQKLEILISQRNDLSFCLDQFLNDRTKGTAWFKVYRQMKMYNDEKLNPSLYASKGTK